VERVGFAGMGTMGAAMAANLARAGARLAVWNRTPGRAASVLALGATEAPTPAALATDADVVVLCLSDTPDVEAVLFCPTGVAEGIRTGSLVIDCSTISPKASVGFAERLAAQGVGFVDAPVSGGSEGAQKGTLTIMCGGSESDVERARPVLAAMGKTITRMGQVGAGQAIKAGLDPETVVDALASGAAGSWVLQNRSGRMIADDYPLGFRIALHRKDLAIALELAREVGAALPVAGMAEQIENGLIAKGHGDDDNSALARAIREWSGL
jgi:3-hydroxyisobutyrate dehydrogenase